MLPIYLIAVAVVGLCLIVFLVVFRAPSSATTNGEGSPAVVGAVRQVAAKEQDQQAEKLRERLIHAGLYKQNSPSFYYLTQLTIAAIPLMMCMIGYRLGLVTFQVAGLVGLIFGILGVVAPGLWLDYKKASRQTSIRRSIPDALDIITICVEAGLSLNSAIVRVSKDLSATYPMLATELIIVHRQIQMGKTAGDALRSFAERFDLAELRALSSVVAQSEKFGASIANALRTHGETMRTKRMQKAHEKAQKAAVYILLPTVLCIFPALFVVILGPAAYDIQEMMKNMGQ